MNTELEWREITKKAEVIGCWCVDRERHNYERCPIHNPAQFNPNDRKALRVTYKGFCGGAMFRKTKGGKWFVWSCAPYLKKMMQSIPVPEWGKHLDKIGAKWEWI